MIERPEQYFERYSGEPKMMLYLMHHFIMGHTGITCKITYDLPFYYGHSWLCYLQVKKDGSIEWAFTHGAMLPNKNGLLQSTHRKVVAGTIIRSRADIKIKEFRQLLKEAVAYDKKVFQSRHKK